MLFLDLVSCQPYSLSWSSFVLPCLPADAAAAWERSLRGLSGSVFQTPDLSSPLLLLSHASLDPITEFCLIFVSFHDISS